MSLRLMLEVHLLTSQARDQTIDAFHAEHEHLYTYASPDLAVEIANLRVLARGPAWPFTPRPLASDHRMAVEPVEMRQVYFPVVGGFTDCPVYAHAALSPGAQLTGPAILVQALTTIVIEPGHRAHMDVYGNIVTAIPSDPAN